MATPGTEEELKFYLRFAKPLALTLTDPSDRVTASAWIQKLKNEEFGALKTRTDHLKILLFVLQKKRLVGRFSENPASIEKLEDFSEDIKLKDIAKQLLEAEVTERRKLANIPPPYYVEYSSDLKEFAASQEIPNFGIQGYYAFSKEPIFLWRKSDKAKLPKDVMELDVDAVHGIHLPLSGAEIARPRLPRSPDKSKPKTISELEKSIAELEGKSGTTVIEEVPVAPIGIPQLEEDREPPTWGSNLGTVSEPPEKEKSPKVKPKSPAVGDIEGDVLEDERPPSFLDVSGTSPERPSPAVCPFVASPRKQSPCVQKAVGDIEGDVLEDEGPPSFLDVSGTSPERPSPAVCPFVASPRKQSPCVQKAVGDIEGDVLEDEGPPSFLDVSGAPSEKASPAVCPFVASSPRRQSPCIKKAVRDIEGDVLEDEGPPSFLDVSGAPSEKASPAVCPFVASSPRRQSPCIKKAVRDIEGDVLEDEGPPSFLDVSGAPSEKASPAVCPFVASSPRRQSPCIKKAVRDIEGDVLEDEGPPSFLDVSGAPSEKTSPPVCPFVTSSPRRQSPCIQKAPSPKTGQHRLRLDDIGGDILDQSQPELAASFIDEIPLSPQTQQRLQSVQKTTTQTIMKDGVPQKTITTVETVEAPEGQLRLDDIEGDILDESQPQLASSFVDQIPLSPKQPSPQQPCPRTITPQGAKRPPFVKPDTQKYVKQHIPGQTPTLPEEERRRKFAAVAKRIDFVPCPSEQRPQDTAGIDERSIVQKTTTETIMKDGVPQRTITTVETVTTPEEPGIEDIEGGEIVPEDLDTSVMREVERELEEAAAQDVEMKEEEYEGMDKYAEMEKELNEMDENMRKWDLLLAELEEEHKDDILAVEREEEEQRKKAKGKSKKKAKKSPQLPLPPPAPSSPSPSVRLPSPCPVPAATSPEEITPTGAPMPLVPVVKRRTPHRHPGGTPVLPEEERRRKYAEAARKLDYGPCPTEQRLQEIAGEAGDDLGLDVSSPDFAASFIDEIPLSPRDVVQAVTHKVITKDGIPQKEITTTTTIPTSVPKRQIPRPGGRQIPRPGGRQIPRPGGVITKVKKEIVSKDGVPQQEIVTTETIPQPSTSKGAISKIPGRSSSRIPCSRIPSSTAAKAILARPSATPRRTPPESVTLDRTRMRLPASDREKRQEELRDVRRRLDWSGGQRRLEDIGGDVLDQSQPELAASFIDEIPLSPQTQQRLQNVQKTTTQTIMKDGVPQKTITTVETVEAPEGQLRLDDIEGDILDESQPQLASSFVDQIPLSPKQPSPQQPCPRTITPQGAKRPPFVKPDTQKYVKQHIPGQTPTLPEEERRRKFAAVAKRIDFVPCPSEQRPQDTAGIDERSVVQKTTTETIMKDGVPQKTVTTVETVKTPEEPGIEDIEGGEIVPEDLDTSVMREVERELEEAAAQDVEMKEEEYEGMDKYAEMEKELNEMDDNMRKWDTLLSQLEEEHKDDILAVEREEEEQRKKAKGKPKKKDKTPPQLPSPPSAPSSPSPSVRLPSPCPLPAATSPEEITPTGAALPVVPVTKRRTPYRHPGSTPVLPEDERRRIYAKAARKLDYGPCPTEQRPDEIPLSPRDVVQTVTHEVVTKDGVPQKEITTTTTIPTSVPKRQIPRPGGSQIAKPGGRQIPRPGGVITKVKKEIVSKDGVPQKETVTTETIPQPSTSRGAISKIPERPPILPAPEQPEMVEIISEERPSTSRVSEYDEYERYKKHRRPDVPLTPPMFSRYKFIRDAAEGTIYEPEQFGVSADEVWQEGAEAVKDLALVRSPTGADAKFFEDETEPELIDQEEEYAKDEEEKKELNKRLGKVMEDIQRIKNEIAESASLPVTLPRKSPSPRRPRVSSDFLTSESPPKFDEILPDEEPVSPLDDNRQQEAFHKIISQEQYPELLDESPPPLSPCELQQIREEIDMRSPSHVRRRLLPSPKASPPRPVPKSPPKAICAEVPGPTGPSTSTAPPEPICPISVSPTEDIDLRQLRRDIQEKAVRPGDKTHFDVVSGKTSAKRRRIPRKSPAPEGRFIEREEHYTSPERVPGWQTPPRLKAKPKLASPQRIREVWDASHAPPRPVPEPLLDEVGPPEELFSQIVDDYEDGVPVKRTETKVTTSPTRKPSTTSPKPVSPKLFIRDKPLQPVQGPGLDDEQAPEELFTQIIDEYVDGIPVKRTETKVTTASPQKEPVCPLQPRSPAAIARDEPYALLDESPPRLIDDEELEQRVDAQADQNLQDIICRSPGRDILDEEEIELVPTSPTSQPATRRSPAQELPLIITPSTSRRPPPVLFYRPSKEGAQIMEEVRKGATPFKFSKYSWDVISGKTRGGKPKAVKRYGRYHRSFIPDPALRPVEEFPPCADGLLEKYSELPGPPQQPLPEDLMGHEVPITSTAIQDGSAHIMDQDVPLGLPSPPGQSRLVGWKTPPHLQYERIKFPKKRSPSQQKSPRPGPSTSPGYTKRKQIFVDGSPVKTIETKVSTPSPKGLDDVSYIEFPESPPPPDERLQPQLQDILDRGHPEDLAAQSPPQFEDVILEDDLPSEPEDHGRILQDILSKDECPGLSGESPPPFSPEQRSPEVVEYDVGGRSPIRIRRRLFPPTSPPSPVSAPCPAPAAVLPSAQVSVQAPIRSTSSPRQAICPITSPPSLGIDPRQLRREIQERAVRPRDKTHFDVVSGKTSAKRRRLPRKSPAPEGTFLEREEHYTSPERVPGWQTPPHLKAKPKLASPQRIREVWDASHAPPQPEPEPLLDEVGPPEELFSQIVDDYEDGVPVKRTETKVTTSPTRKPSTTSPKPVSPKLFIRDKPLQPVQGPGLDDEQAPEELFTQIIDEYVDGIPVKRTETKVTTASPQKEPVCPLQPRSPAAIARDEPYALLDESPPRLIDDEELEQRVDAQADRNLQDIICRSPGRDILDEEEIELVPTSPTSQPATRRSPAQELPLISTPSTSRRPPPVLFYRPSQEGAQIMEEVRKGATPFKFSKYSWDVISGKTRGGKPKAVKRYGRYHRSFIPDPALKPVEEFPPCADGLLEKYSELPGPPQQPLPEDLMGHEVPITSTAIQDGSAHIMDQDVPLGLPSPPGQSRLVGWKTPPHLQYERIKFPKKRSPSQQKSPRPGPSTSPGYTKRKQIFVDGSPVKTIETKVSTPSPKGLDDVSYIEFPESPPPPDERLQPQLQDILDRGHPEDLAAQSPPQFEDVILEDDLPSEPEDHGRILQDILSKDECPGLSGESPPPFSPEQRSPEVVEYDVGGGSPIRIRRRLFPTDSPPMPAPARAVASPRHTSPVCPPTSPSSPEIDLRRLKRDVREKAVRPRDRHHVDVVLGKTAGKRRRIPKQSSGPESRFIEREEEDVVCEPGVPGWSTPPRLARTGAEPLKLPQFDLWTDYGERRHKAAKPPVVTEITEEMVDGVPVRRVETTVQRSPVSRPQISEESPPPFIQTPPQRSPPGFRSMSQQVQQYSPLSEMSPPPFFVSPPRTSPRQIPLTSLYDDADDVLDTTPPELVCSPSDSPRRTQRQIPLPTVHQDAEGLLDISQPELVCGSPPQQRIRSPGRPPRQIPPSPRRSPRQIPPSPRRSPRHIPLPVQHEGAQGIEGTSPPPLAYSPPPEHVLIRTSPGSRPIYHTPTSHGGRVFMPSWPEPGTPTSEYSTDVAFGGRFSPGILDTSPISGIESDEECDFSWMG